MRKSEMGEKMSYKTSSKLKKVVFFYSFVVDLGGKREIGSAFLHSDVDKYGGASNEELYGYLVKKMIDGTAELKSVDPEAVTITGVNYLPNIGDL